MKTIIIASAAILLAASVPIAPASVAMAQGNSDKPLSAVPPSGRADHSVNSVTRDKGSSGTDPAASKEGNAHNTGNVANGPTPPRQIDTVPRASAPSGPASSTVVPGAAYNSGTANVGNSSESKGIPGSQGAGASATMQSGHTSN